MQHARDVDRGEHAAVEAVVAAREGGDVRIVGDRDEGGAGVLGGGVEHRHDLAAGLHVEGAGRLVGEDQARTADEGSGDRDALLLAAGELVGLRLQAFAEPHALEHLASRAVRGARTGDPTRRAAAS